MMTRRYAALSSIALALSLAACGGGGSSGPVTSTPPPPPPAPSPTPTPTPTPTSTEEYNNSAAVSAAKAQYAYDEGYTGAGVTIAIIDSGIDTDNAEFEGRINDASQSFTNTFARCGTCSTETVTYDLDDVQGHGTWVAAIAAGAANGNAMHGVAYEADILALKIAGSDLDNIADGEIPPESGLNGQNIAPAINYALDNGAFVINLSANGLTSGQTSIDLHDAMANVAANDAIFVQSVSNSNENSFDGTMTEDLVGSDLEFADWFLYGIRVDQNLNAIAGNGDPGALAHRTLAVVAQDLVVIGVDGEVTTVTGNSFAAPAITGAAALLKQYWPQLGGAEISGILLSTATDLGDPGVDQIYGAGLLNIEAAFKSDNAQMGSSQVTMSSVKSTALVTSAPFGGSSAGEAFDAAPTYAIDSWGREFRVDAGKLVHGAQAGGFSLGNVVQSQVRPELTAYEQTLGAVSFAATDQVQYDQRAPQSYAARLGPQTVVYASTNAGIAGSEIMTNSLLKSANVATDGTSSTIVHQGHSLTFAAAETGDEQMGAKTTRVALELPNGLSASYTKSREIGSALGMRGTGAFAIDGASSDFISLGWSGDIEGFDITAEAMAGRTQVETSGSMLAFDDAVLSSGFRFIASRDALGGLMLVGLTSPIKVDRANVTYTAADGYDLATRSLTYRDNALSMAAGAREIDFEVGYTRSLPLGSLSLNAAYALNAGNSAGERSAAASLRFNTAF